MKRSDSILYLLILDFMFSVCFFFLGLFLMRSSIDGVRLGVLPLPIVGESAARDATPVKVRYLSWAPGGASDRDDRRGSCKVNITYDVTKKNQARPPIESPCWPAMWGGPAVSPSDELRVLSEDEGARPVVNCDTSEGIEACSRLYFVAAERGLTVAMAVQRQ